MQVDLLPVRRSENPRLYHRIYMRERRAKERVARAKVEPNLSPTERRNVKFLSLLKEEWGDRPLP